MFFPHHHRSNIFFLAQSLLKNFSPKRIKFYGKVWWISSRIYFWKALPKAFYAFAMIYLATPEMETLFHRVIPSTLLATQRTDGNQTSRSFRLVDNWRKVPWDWPFGWENNSCQSYIFPSLVHNLQIFRKENTSATAKFKFFKCLS